MTLHPSGKSGGTEANLRILLGQAIPGKKPVDADAGPLQSQRIGHKARVSDPGPGHINRSHTCQRCKPEGRGTLPAASIALVLLVASMLSPPAVARDEVELLVNRSIVSFSTTDTGLIHAQRFTTGSQDKLAKLIDVFMPTESSNTTGAITLNADNSGVPGAVIATLSGFKVDGVLADWRSTDSFDWLFPTGGTLLTADTSYFLIFNANDNGFSYGERVGAFQFYPRPDLDRQDFGWSVDTQALVKEAKGDAWSTTEKASYNIGAFRIMGFGPDEDPDNPDLSTDTSDNWHGFSDEDTSGRPATPGRPKVTAGSTTSLNVDWSAPSDGGSPLTGYNIAYQEGSGSWMTWNHSGTETETVITGLSPGTSYGVRIQAVNNNGASGWSGAGRGRTDIRPNNPPEPADDTATTDEDTSVEIDVLANDPADLDEGEYGDMLKVVRVSNPPHGRAWITIDPDDADRQMVGYAPDPDFNGEDAFEYTVDDGSGTGTARASATVTVTINSLPDPPHAGHDRVETDVDTPVVIEVLANDRDADGDPLDVTSVTDPAHGTAVLNVDDTVTYTPDPEYEGMDAFTYVLEADDGDPDTPDTATGNVTVRIRPPFVERVNRAHSRILPEVTRTVTDMSQDAISVRLEAAGTGGPGASASLSLGGASDLAGALLAQAPGMQAGTFDVGRFLDDSSFSLGFGDAGRGYTLWGGGDYRALSNSEVVDSTGFLYWSGEVLSAHLGGDTRVRPDLLAGLMISTSQADFDYVEDADGTEGSGRYRLDLWSFNPYARWTMSSGGGAVGHAGYGQRGYPDRR